MSLKGSTQQFITRKIHVLSDADAWRYSDKEIIASARRNWPSNIYDHYIIFLIRYYTEGGEPNYMEFRFECKFACPLHEHQFRARKTKTRSGKLWTSARQCEERQQIKANPETTAQDRKDLAWICIQCSLLRTSPGSANILLMIPGHVNSGPHDGSFLSSPITEGLKNIYSSLASVAFSHFQNVSGAFHLIVDGWTNITPTDSLVCVVVVWQQEGRVFRSVLDLAWVCDLRSEGFLSDFTSQCLERFGLLGKIKSVCISNAPHSEQLVQDLCVKHSSLRPDIRIMCYPHIVRLMAEAFISFLRPQPRVTLMKFSNLPSEDESERTVEWGDRPLHYYLSEPDYNAEIVQWAVGKAHQRVRRLGLCIEDNVLQSAHGVLGKVKSLEQFIDETGSPELREIYWGCSEQGSDSEANIPAARPRAFGQWSTVWDSIDRCLRFQPTFHKQLDTNIPNLGGCFLEETQLKLLEDFHRCLQAFHKLGIILSRQEIPFLHEVVEELFTLRAHLEDICNDRLGTNLTSVARMAAAAALSAYELIGKGDMLPEVYSILMVMRPTHKLQWFEERGMNTQRISALVEAYFEENYPLIKRENDEEGLVDLVTAQTDNLKTYLSSSVLSEKVIEERGGLLSYWNLERKTSPRVAQMALDHLTIPASSVDPTRTLSGGPVTTNGLEAQVDRDVFRAAMSIGSWFGTPVLKDIDAVANILEEHPCT
ncbi:hAT family dimerization protein [Rhizoctonia solani AG-3 Rhs1AP]|uniref:HAT family dimerization protein n=1 Tax=Rhizoctonia solani AG-3 Rhs1AP TaxID=1086054 RepID=X8J2P8_9AGAM|nr:hAT family dimerization protein [Rhizoctonia solani AG-3 Rhs1AP]